MVFLRVLAICTLLGTTWGHGYITCPKPRMYRDNPVCDNSWTNWVGITVPGDLSYAIGEGNAPNLNSAIGGGWAGATKEVEEGHSLCGDISSRKGFMAPNAFGPTIPRGIYQSGGTMDVSVKITAYHAGWIEFRLCVPDDQSVDTTTPITQSCLNEHVLKIDRSTIDYDKHTNYVGDVSGVFRCKNEGSLLDNTATNPSDVWPTGSCCNGGGSCSAPQNNDDRYVLNGQQLDYDIVLKVPQVQCDRCVLQMLYQTGNSVDAFPETFYNCADIKIVPETDTTDTGCAAYTPQSNGGCTDIPSSSTGTGGDGGDGGTTPTGEFPVDTCTDITQSCDKFEQACADWCPSMSSVRCGEAGANVPEGQVAFTCNCGTTSGLCIVTAPVVDDNTAPVEDNLNCDTIETCNDGGDTGFKSVCDEKCSAAGSTALNKQCYGHYEGGIAALCKCNNGHLVTGSVCGTTGKQLTSDGTNVYCCSNCDKKCTGSTLVPDVDTGNGDDNGVDTSLNSDLYGVAPDMSVARVKRSASMLDIADPIVSLTSNANPPNVNLVKTVFPEAKWNDWFAFSNAGQGTNVPPFTYENFLKSVAKFPYFCGEGTAPEEEKEQTCKRELALLMAQFVQETGANNPNWGETWKQGLYYYEEIGCAGGGCTQYSECGSPGSDFCAEFPCEAGQTYHGRGAHQLSYCYNYGPFSYALLGDDTLLKDPSQVTSTWLGLASALWFYMTPSSPKPSMHDVAVGHWTPNSADSAANIVAGLGAVVNIINGGIECNGGGETDKYQVQNRVEAYKKMCADLGINAYFADEALENTCKTMGPFPMDGTAGSIPAYWGKDWSSSSCKLVTYPTAYSFFVEGSKQKCELFHYGASSGNDGSDVTDGGPVQSDQSVRCGTDWNNANTKCGTGCVSDADCPGSEQCFAGVAISRCEGTSEPGEGTSEPGGSDSNTGLPASSDVRCGTSWADANGKCGTICISDSDCPAGEYCYAGCSLEVAGCEGSNGGGIVDGTSGTGTGSCPVLGGNSGDKTLMAFVENWVACPTDAQLSQYTHLVVSFAVTYTWAAGGNNCDANCVLKDTPGCSGLSMAGLVTRAHALGVKVLISLGGAGMGGSWDTSINRCWDPCLNKVDDLANQVVQQVQSSGADGVDIDYEYIYEAKHVQFLKDLTTSLRTKLDELGPNKLITHAPMGADLHEGDPYIDVLQAVGQHIDYIMPQYYNGYMQIPKSATSATEWSRVEKHYRYLVSVMGGNANKIVFGFCISDCIPGHNTNAQTALDIVKKVDSIFPDNGGSYFWAGSDDTPSATWSRGIADLYCAAEEDNSGCPDNFGTYKLEQLRPAELVTITVSNPYGTISFEEKSASEARADYLEIFHDYQGMTDEQVSALTDLTQQGVSVDAQGLVSLKVPVFVSINTDNTDNTSGSMKSSQVSLLTVFSLAFGLMFSCNRARASFLVMLVVLFCLSSGVSADCADPVLNMRVRLPAGCTVKESTDYSATIECMEPTDPCANRPCEHVCEQGTCSCNANYVLAEDGASCTIMNPCNEDNGGCSQLCQSPQGVAICSCDADHTLAADSKSCTPIDPCLTNYGGCDSGTTLCRYVGPNKRTCRCKTGYTIVDSTSCEEESPSCDVNSCANPNGACVSTTDGREECGCQSGYQCAGSGCTTCEAISDGTQVSCNDIPAYQTNGVYVGGDQTVFDQSGLYEAKWWTNVSPEGNTGEGKPWKLVGTCGGDPPTVEDGTCNSVPPPCSQKCDYSTGTVECSCDEGFTLGQTGACEANDACAGDNNGCAETCISPAGNCLCADDKVLSANGKDCDAVVAEPTPEPDTSTGCGGLDACQTNTVYQSGDQCSCPGTNYFYVCKPGVSAWCSSSSDMYSPCLAGQTSTGGLYWENAWTQNSC